MTGHVVTSGIWVSLLLASIFIVGLSFFFRSSFRSCREAQWLAQIRSVVYPRASQLRLWAHVGTWSFPESCGQRELFQGEGRGRSSGQTVPYLSPTASWREIRIVPSKPQGVTVGETGENEKEIFFLNMRKNFLIVKAIGRWNMVFESSKYTVTDGNQVWTR